MPSEEPSETIAIASDHAGFELKQDLKRFLTEGGYEVHDVGTDSTESVDYPDFAAAVARAVASGAAWRGIMIDAAGIGSCMAANKIAGVRAALCYDRATARNSREHNNANVLTLGARMHTSAEAREIVHKAQLDVGGVEYIESSDGHRYFYDINAPSVYRRDIVEASGVDAMTKFVDFIEREYRKEQRKRREYLGAIDSDLRLTG